MINIVKYENVPIADTPHQVDVRQLFENDHVAVVEIKLGHGQGLKKHVTPVDALFYIIEGHGIIEIGEEQEQVSSDMLIISPRGIPHTMRNEGDEPLRFLVIKAPAAEAE